MQSDRRELAEELRPVLGEKLPNLDYRRFVIELEVAVDQARSLEAALGGGWKALLCMREGAPQTERQAWQHGSVFVEPGGGWANTVEGDDECRRRSRCSPFCG
ncbi:MAG: hypothetical protein ACC642_10645 [Pseudomonadales bacterium]